MKIKIISDIHLEHFCAAQVFDVGSGEILVLAGDILCTKHLKKNGYLRNVYERFLNDCAWNYKHILYVLGNHEFYGYNYEGAKTTIKEHLPSNFHLLDNDTFSYKDWTFIGTTLWSDFRNENPLEMMDAAQYLNDYKMIRIGPNYRKLTPDDTLRFHKESKAYILKQLETLKENVFIITHHAPSYQSVAPQYKNYANGAYVSDLDDLIISHPQIKYWIHGHTHSFWDYHIGQCRVICNPVGYPGQCNTGYNPELVIEL
jgi:predicted phosphodiesterase